MKLCGLDTIYTFCGHLATCKNSMVFVGLLSYCSGLESVLNRDDMVYVADKQDNVLCQSIVCQDICRHFHAWFEPVCYNLNSHAAITLL